MQSPLKSAHAGSASDAAGSTHRLCFPAMQRHLKAVVVPCDATGQVHLDSLSDRARNAYLGARALMGWMYAPPRVERAIATR